MGENGIKPDPDTNTEMNFCSVHEEGSTLPLGWEDTELTEEDVRYYGNSVKIHIATDNTDEDMFETFTRDYPMSEKEKCMCAVYEDLQKRGVYITSAMKFGGDFLVYPGDPLRHHSHYIVVVMQRSEQL